MASGNTYIISRAFSGLDQTTLDELRNVARRKTYPPQFQLCRQGEVAHTFYIIVDGRVAATQHLETGEERFLEILGPKHYFGEMGLIDDTPRMATCTTLTETVVLEINEEAFDSFMRRSPVLANHLTRTILKNARNNDRQALAELQEKNAALEKALTELQAAQAEVIQKERLERELELAAEVQRQLLPFQLPQVPGYNFAAALTPARYVGGDFYDVIPLGQDRIGLLMADVADKGYHAALFMAVTRTLFYQECRRHKSPAHVAEAVHKGMLEISPESDIFVTALYGVLHRHSGQFTYVRAGHERPYLFRLGEDVIELPGDGRFLGMIEPLHLEETTVHIQSGDRLVLYSDGAPDAINLAGEHFGSRRLRRAIERLGSLSAGPFVTKLQQEIELWRGEADPFDDLTLLVVEARHREA